MTSLLFGKNNGFNRSVGPFEIGKTIGEGTFSKVKLGRERENPSHRVALKIMDPDRFRNQAIQRELDILRHFSDTKRRHPNICSLTSILHNVDYPSKYGLRKSVNDSRKVSIIVTDYSDGGDLYAYVAAGVAIDEKSASAIFQQVVRGISHLHRHGIVHLDIKPENILLSTTGIVKITDFGLSEVVKTHEGMNTSTSAIRKSKTYSRKQAQNNDEQQRLNKASHAMSPPLSLESLENSVSTDSLEKCINTVSKTNCLSGSTAKGQKNHAVSLPTSQNVCSSNIFESVHTDGKASGSSFNKHPDKDDRELPPDGAMNENYQEKDTSTGKNGSDISEQDESDAALFQAISSGHTRESYNDLTSLCLSAPVTYFHGKQGANAISKSTSLSSIASLESANSLYSSQSKRSITSRYISPRLEVSSQNGTRCYQAPEVHGGKYDGSKADIFSLGIVMHVMVYGVLPFEDNGFSSFMYSRDVSEYGERIDTSNVHFTGSPPLNNNQAESAFSYSSSSHDADSDKLSGDVSSAFKIEWEPPCLLKSQVDLSDTAIELLRGMLNLDPKLRFSLKDVVRHPWVEASKVRGAVHRVAALVKRRRYNVMEMRNQRSLQRKMKKRNTIDSKIIPLSLSEERILS